MFHPGDEEELERPLPLLPSFLPSHELGSGSEEVCTDKDKKRREGKGNARKKGFRWHDQAGQQSHTVAYVRKLELLSSSRSSPLPSLPPSLPAEAADSRGAYVLVLVRTIRRREGDASSQEVLMLEGLP